MHNPNRSGTCCRSGICMYPCFASNEVSVLIKGNKMLLIINPRAGKCKGNKVLMEILRIFQRSGFLSTVMVTEKSGDAAEFVIQYGNQHDLIVCIGGDGTLSEVIAGIVKGEIAKPIGYIPAGSANDYGSSLGLSSDLYTAAYDILNGSPEPFDIGLYNNKPFAYVAALGTFAKVSYSTSQDMKNVCGHFAYVLEGIRNLHTLRSEHMVFDIDGERIEGDFILGMISNTLSVGGLLRFNPQQVMMDDGYLEIMLVSMPSSPKDLSDIIQAVSTQSYSGCSSIIFRRGQQISIHSKEQTSWSLDGEYTQDYENISITIVPKAVQIVVPEMRE